MRIVLLGPPGVGKGTQGKLLSKELKVPLIVMGDILRERVKKQDSLGEKVKKFIEKGELVPDNLIIEIISQRLNREDCKKGFILDGFPRTKIQAQILDNFLEKERLNLDIVIFYKIKEKLLIERIIGRRICKKCGAIYHIKNSPPLKENICDKCGGELYQRVDDKLDIVKNRLNTYSKNTYPLMEYYKDKGILVEIDANKTIENILKETLDIIKKLEKNKK